MEFFLCGCSSTQRTRSLFLVFNSDDHERFHKTPPLIHILSQPNPKHTFTVKNHSDIKLTSTLRPSNCSLHFNFSTKIMFYLQVFRHSVEFLCPVFITLPYFTNVGTQVMPCVYFLRNYNYNYNEMYLFIGYISSKDGIIFPQSLLHYQHTLPAFA